MLAERGLRVDHVSLHRRVQRFAPEFERRLRPHPMPVGRLAARTRARRERSPLHRRRRTRADETAPPGPATNPGPSTRRPSTASSRAGAGRAAALRRGRAPARLSDPTEARLHRPRFRQAQRAVTPGVTAGAGTAPRSVPRSDKPLSRRAPRVAEPFRRLARHVRTRPLPAETACGRPRRSARRGAVPTSRSRRPRSGPAARPELSDRRHVPVSREVNRWGEPSAGALRPDAVHQILATRAALAGPGAFAKEHREQATPARRGPAARRRANAAGNPPITVNGGEARRRRTGEQTP
jgi:hypothetical protein